MCVVCVCVVCVCLCVCVCVGCDGHRRRGALSLLSSQGRYHQIVEFAGFGKEILHVVLPLLCVVCSMCLAACAERCYPFSAGRGSIISSWICMSVVLTHVCFLSICMYVCMYEKYVSCCSLFLLCVCDVCVCDFVQFWLYAVLSLCFNVFWHTAPHTQISN